ncbi:MAG: hypothetical protein NXY57DRAFT_906641 [Lentinula lateritia]|nr:MAG: hypothetical protein NXY57DRAFT_906641 [Lentinula lateritia]
MGVLETHIRANIAGVLSSRAHSDFCKTYIGTKDLIESYYDEQEKAPEFGHESPDIPLMKRKGV